MGTMTTDRIATLIARAEQEGLLDVVYATADSPVGTLTLAATPKGLVRVGYGETDQVLQALAAEISPRVLKATAQLDCVRRELDEYFTGRRHDFDVAIDWSLVHTPFRRAVLERTARIPYGETATYRDMAEAAGSRGAVRAAGTALGANPIPVVVPCHRVLRTGGDMGQYAGGVERKRYLLDLERTHAA
jgi:methylated-DNA-[protein]-cysteine S-methyltransferase